MYNYAATVVRVIDGDTVVLDVDLGFKMWLRRQSFRLAGVNARELDEPGGAEARDHLAALLPPGAPVEVTSVRPDKYGGRYDAVIFVGQRDVGAQLVAEQWAARWSGTGLKPIPPWPRTSSFPPASEGS